VGGKPTKVRGERRMRRIFGLPATVGDFVGVSV
jgi:hypothetical protein